MWRMEMDLERFLSVVVPGDVEGMARSYGFGEPHPVEAHRQYRPDGTLVSVQLQWATLDMIVPFQRSFGDYSRRMMEAIVAIALARGVSPTVVLWELLPDAERGELASYLIPQGPGRDNTMRCRSCGTPTNITIARACPACADLPGGPRCRHCEQPMRKPMGDCGCEEG